MVINNADIHCLNVQRACVVPSDEVSVSERELSCRTIAKDAMNEVRT